MLLLDSSRQLRRLLQSQSWNAADGSQNPKIFHSKNIFQPSVHPLEVLNLFICICFSFIFIFGPDNE